MRHQQEQRLMRPKSLQFLNDIVIVQCHVSVTTRGRELLGGICHVLTLERLGRDNGQHLPVEAPDRM